MWGLTAPRGFESRPFRQDSSDPGALLYAKRSGRCLSALRRSEFLTTSPPRQRHWPHVQPLRPAPVSHLPRSLPAGLLPGWLGLPAWPPQPQPFPRLLRRNQPGRPAARRRRPRKRVERGDQIGAWRVASLCPVHGVCTCARLWLTARGPARASALVKPCSCGPSSSVRPTPARPMPASLALARGCQARGLNWRPLHRCCRPRRCREIAAVDTAAVRLKVIAPLSPMLKKPK